MQINAIRSLNDAKKQYNQYKKTETNFGAGAQGLATARRASYAFMGAALAAITMSACNTSATAPEQTDTKVSVDTTKSQFANSAPMIELKKAIQVLFPEAATGTNASGAYEPLNGDLVQLNYRDTSTTSDIEYTLNSSKSTQEELIYNTKTTNYLTGYIEPSELSVKKVGNSIITKNSLFTSSKEYVISGDSINTNIITSSGKTIKDDVLRKSLSTNEIKVNSPSGLTKSFLNVSYVIR